eukprot:7645540-Prorocentrum_lima.AAC.1
MTSSLVGSEMCIRDRYKKMYRPYGRAWAVKGSSPLEASYHRAVLDESACVIGASAVTALWDLHKYYDTVHLPTLVKAAGDLDWDVQPLFVAC